MAQQLEYHIDMEERSKWEIISANTAAKENFIYVQEAGMFYSGPSYYTTRENLNSYLIKLTLSGKGKLTYKDTVYEVSAGDFFWIDCMEHQDYRTAPTPGHWHVLWVHFYGSNASNYYSVFQTLNHNRPVSHLSDSHEAKRIMERILDLYDNSSGELQIDIQGASLITQLLSILLSSAATPSTAKTPPVVSKIQNYLFENYKETITLDGISNQFNISKFHLLRVFRQHLGVTPYEYLKNIRITKAKELLRTTDYSIDMIANAVGIDSASYFIVTFKKIEGLTPHKYRTAWRNDLNI